jgi:hypothetical protein
MLFLPRFSLLLVGRIRAGHFRICYMFRLHVQSLTPYSTAQMLLYVRMGLRRLKALPQHGIACLCSCEVDFSLLQPAKTRAIAYPGTFIHLLATLFPFFCPPVSICHLSTLNTGYTTASGRLLDVTACRCYWQSSAVAVNRRRAVIRCQLSFCPFALTQEIRRANG